MKKYCFMLAAAFILFTGHAFAQKWSDLSREEKMMKIQAFVEDNQKYMRDSLKLSEDQINDVNNVNVCYLSTLDRIDRYIKIEADKERYAQAVTNARGVQLEAIMGAEKHRQLSRYIGDKLKKAAAKM
jgi:hypothetical protein